ncbi:DUF6290 family protein [Saccharolobus islandicus]|uniref:DUF6290 family protein n=1 Tax=Saccharolobus islandicus TaxID=43080 RepID=UPI000382421E|nr:DUF6290 family protein [Sulfolobus islandicus]
MPFSIFFNPNVEQCLGGGENLKHTSHFGIRLREEDRKLIKQIAEKYDISESDVMRMALREFIEKHEVKISS